MNKCFIFFHKDTEKEKPPPFLKESCYCEDIKTQCIFIPLIDIIDYGDNPQKQWQEIKKKIISSETLTILVFSHGLQEIAIEFFKELEKDNSFSLHLDYSGGDPSYTPMWEQIRKAEDCSRLAQVLEYWRKYYLIDPYRRIKHRAINLFGPLTISTQHILELWDKKEFLNAKNIFKELKEEWASGRSPSSELTRLWYMLIGNKLDWNKNDIPEKPNDVSLPKKKVIEGEGLSFYDWLSEYHGKSKVNELKEWESILAHVQLIHLNIIEDDKFDRSCSSGMFDFLKALEKLDHEKFGPDEKIRGFQERGLKEELNNVLEWFNELNDLFEKIINLWVKESSS